MMLMKHAALFAALAAITGCVLDEEPPRRIAPAPFESAPPPAASEVQAPATGTPPAPMLVEVDTDQTMTADPGQGVGLFIEYSTGGRWHLWWTCDTARTGKACDFSVTATAASGDLTDVDATQVPGGFVGGSTPSRVEARVRTSREVHGVSFTSAAGAVVTIEAAVSGIKDGSFLFFVQDGKVNGGYAGRVTNPLQVQGKSP